MLWIRMKNKPGLKDLWIRMKNRNFTIKPINKKENRHPNFLLNLFNQVNPGLFFFAVIYLIPYSDRPDIIFTFQHLV